MISLLIIKDDVIINIKNLKSQFKKTIKHYKLSKEQNLLYQVKKKFRNCSVCIQTVKTIHKIEPCKAITVNCPGQRYKFDLTYLNDELSQASDFKYLTGIIGIFSQKAMIYKNNNKDSEAILQNIIEFF